MSTILTIAALLFRVVLILLDTARKRGEYNDTARATFDALYVRLIGMVDHDKKIRDRVERLGVDDLGRLLDKLGSR